jgi:hypothetical protein
MVFRSVCKRREQLRETAAGKDAALTSMVREGAKLDLVLFIFKALTVIVNEILP